MTHETENTDPIQSETKPWQFKRGQSGNPSGRPRGAKNQATILAEKLLASEVEAVVSAVIAAAIAGDMAACRLVLERLVAPVKERAVEIELPALSGAKDLPMAMQAILLAAADGQLTPSQAQSLAGLVEAWRKAIETSDLSERITQLEQHAKS